MESRLNKILLIAPHYPPSNLAAVHRTRLFAQHLPELGWQPFILTVDEHFYEEALDWNLFNLIPPDQHIYKVNAFGITKPRLIGDIGLRAFFQLRKKAFELVKELNIDFVYIPIPSFYTALIGTYLHKKLGVHFGIDYIDPWVHDFPGANRIFSRHWWSKQLAKYLEPIALRNVALVTGVAEGYYKGVLDRNPNLIKSTLFAAMPYGAEKKDHIAVQKMKLSPYVYHKKNKIQLVYAGAILPKAVDPLELFFQSIKENLILFNDVEFYFIGSGKTPNDPSGYNVKPIAKKYGLWEKQIFEFPQRIPYLDVLVHLDNADGIFILGSTEPHYTPSKVYQAVLSNKPIFAILHEHSSAASIIEKSNAGIVQKINAENLSFQKQDLIKKFEIYREFLNNFSPDNVDRFEFEKYSAKNVTAILVDNLNKIIE